MWVEIRISRTNNVRPFVYNLTMQKVIFYTKLNCSLCDKAYQMLMDIILEFPLEIDILDITHAHNKLEPEYGHRIPVIALSNASSELQWPFNLDEIRAYLTQS